MKKNYKYKKIILSSIILTNLLSATDELATIIVTAKTENSSLDTANSFSIVTQKEIDSMSATSIQEVLKEVVGINIGINDGSFAGRESISIRGTDSRHVLILIDGKRISGSDAQIGHSNFQYNWLPINSIEKIEIVRGAMSSLYGSQAIGGVVNIITKKVDKKLTGSLGVGLGKSSRDGGDEQEISLNIATEITDKLSLSLFAQKKDIEMTKNDSNASLTSDREGKEIKNGMINIGYDADDMGKIEASYLKGEEKRDVILYSSRRGASISYDAFYDIDKEHYSLDYQKNFDEIGIDLKYYRTKSDAHSQNLNLTHSLDDKVFNVEVDTNSFDNHYIVVGAEHRDEGYHKGYDTNSSKDFKDNIEYQSLYIQDEVELGEKSLLTVGGRYDEHERFGGEFSPKIYLVHKLNKNSRIKGGYAEGFNAPTVTQGSSAYKVHSMFIISGDDNLLPEKSKSYELSYAYQSDKRAFTGTLFHTKIKNLIDTKKIGEVPMGRMSQNILIYSNVNRVKMDGLELEFNQKNLVDNLDADIGYSYLKTKDETTNKELYARPKQTANFRLSYPLPYGIDSTIRLNYIGTQRNFEDKKLASYTTGAIQLKKDFSKGFSARVGVENIGDKKLEDDHNYQLKGRFIYGRFSYDF